MFFVLRMVFRNSRIGSFVCVSYQTRAFYGRPRVSIWIVMACDCAICCLKERGENKIFPAVQRKFLYLPFMHSESLADQEVSMREAKLE